jgi:alpha-amylase
MIFLNKIGWGTGGSSVNVGSLQYPSVPFGPNDFNPQCSINNYGDPNQVRNCWLVGLPDLRVGTEYVRQKIADFMNDLIDIGVAGEIFKNHLFWNVLIN